MFAKVALRTKKLPLDHHNQPLSRVRRQSHLVYSEYLKFSALTPQIDISLKNSIISKGKILTVPKKNLKEKHFSKSHLAIIW